MAQPKTDLPKRVYITQFDAWWSYPLPAYLELCEKAAANDGCFTLDNWYSIKSRPSFIKAWRDRETGRTSYDTRRRDVRVVKCLDWDAEYFQFELNELRPAAH